MQRFTRSRDPTQDDEIWLLQHPPVFTLGKASRAHHLLDLALNVAMDLSPFSRIDPCGYPGLAVTDMKSCLGYAPDFGQVQAQLAASITASLQAHDREQTTPYEQQP
ncbi:MAG: hypothetical protein EBX67_00190 [Betaproteobacteria bacterium]|nr:hypothetical protein [Betaproteobacteria bacterium]